MMDSAFYGGSQECVAMILNQGMETARAKAANLDSASGGPDEAYDFYCHGFSSAFHHWVQEGEDALRREMAACVAVQSATLETSKDLPF